LNPRPAARRTVVMTVGREQLGYALRAVRLRRGNLHGVRFSGDSVCVAWSEVQGPRGWRPPCPGT
jgi:hypothetical protein